MYIGQRRPLPVLAHSLLWQLPKLPLQTLFGLCCFIYKEQYTPEVEPSRIADTYLTGSASAVTICGIFGQIYVIASCSGQLGVSQASITSHATAGDTYDTEVLLLLVTESRAVIYAAYFKI